MDYQTMTEEQLKARGFELRNAIDNLNHEYGIVVSILQTKQAPIPEPTATEAPAQASAEMPVETEGKDATEKPE